MKKFFAGFLFIFSLFFSNASAQTPEEKAMFDAGVQFARDGRFESARNEFESLSQRASAASFNSAFLAKLRYNLGTCNFRLGDAQRAVAEFERAVKLADGNYEMALYALGMAQTELKNWSEAATAFHRALRINDRNGEAWFDLAFVYLAQNDYDSAAVAFEKSIKNKSSAAAFAHNNLGVIFALRGDLATAEKQFRIAIKKADGRLPLAEENLKFTKSRDWNAVRSSESRSSAFTRPFSY